MNGRRRRPRRGGETQHGDEEEGREEDREEEGSEKDSREEVLKGSKPTADIQEISGDAAGGVPFHYRRGSIRGPNFSPVGTCGTGSGSAGGFPTFRTRILLTVTGSIGIPFR